MLRLMLAFTSVYLCLCLLGVTQQGTAKIRTRDLLRWVNNLIGQVQILSQLDCRLYTPTTEDYQNCPGSTLRCFAEEVKVLLEEWKASGSSNNLPLKFSLELEKLASKMSNGTEAGCLQCELLNEKEAGLFLKDLETTLQMMSSDDRSLPGGQPWVLRKKTFLRERDF